MLAIQLLAYTIFHAGIIFIPIVFFSAFFYERINQKRLISLAIGACGSGIFVYLIFWLSLANARLGIAVALVSYVGMCVYFFTEIMKKSWPEFWQEWFMVFLFWVFYSLFLLALGFSSIGFENILYSVAKRFSHELPIDNQIPFIFANQIASGKVQIPMIGDWLSSDRPPLQTAYFLASGGVFFPKSELHYQINSTLLQSIWIIALWFVFKEWMLSRLAVITGLLVPMFSGFAIVHSLYTWPKLFPVFFIILIFGILFSSSSVKLLNWRDGGLVGVLAALAMLGHGGSIFPLLGMGLTLLLFKRLPSAIFVFFAVVGGIVLMGTWSMYQAYFDPPGSRLLKWHLAGVVPIDSRSFGKALIESYQNLSFEKIFHNKYENIKALVGNFSIWAPNLWNTVFGKASVDRILLFRSTQFFTIAANLGIFVLAPLFLLKGKKVSTENERNLGIRAYIAAVCSIGFWVILLFGPGDAVIHQGSLAVLIFLFVGSVLILINASKLLTIIFSMFHFVGIAKVYFGYGWQSKDGYFDLSLLILSIICFIFTIFFAVVASLKFHEVKVAQ